MAGDGMFADFAEFAQEWMEKVRDQAEEILVETAADGVEAIQERIMTAVTPWGSARQAGLASGPPGTETPREFAGRRETDLMYDSVDYWWIDQSDERLEIAVGWPDERLEDYFLIQEHGGAGIVPMESLAISQFEAEDALQARLDRIGWTN